MNQVKFLELGLLLQQCNLATFKTFAPNPFKKGTNLEIRKFTVVRKVQWTNYQSRISLVITTFWAKKLDFVVTRSFLTGRRTLARHETNTPLPREGELVSNYVRLHLITVVCVIGILISHYQSNTS